MNIYFHHSLSCSHSESAQQDPVGMVVGPSSQCKVCCPPTSIHGHEGKAPLNYSLGIAAREKIGRQHVLHAL